METGVLIGLAALARKYGFMAKSRREFLLTSITVVRIGPETPHK